MEQTLNLFRVLLVIVCAFIGSNTAIAFGYSDVRGILIGIGSGVLIALCDRVIRGLSIRAFSSATFGLVLGLVFATILKSSGILKYKSDDVQWLVSMLFYVIFGYIGAVLAMKSNREDLAMIIPYIRFRAAGTEPAPVIIDSNIIIDGRAASFFTSGFIEGGFVVPDFILKELQFLADSKNTQKRDTGKRALHNLEILKKITDVKVYEGSLEGSTNTTVDFKLIACAKVLGARLFTSDSNLVKIARVQNIPVLCLSELLFSLKAQYHKGDVIELQITGTGKDEHQGIGHISDGTIVVVNNASAHIGTKCEVVVLSVMTNTSGKMIFADIKL